MEQFRRDHDAQLQALHIPPMLYPGLWEQLEATYPTSNNTDNEQNASPSPQLPLTWTPAGTLMVIPPVCRWNIVEQAQNGLWQALTTQVSVATLRRVYQGLVEAQERQAFYPDHTTTTKLDTVALLTNSDNNEDDDDSIRWRLQNAICSHVQTWPRIVLYQQQRESGGGVVVRAALPPPPYAPVSNLKTTGEEADLTGPFPFFYTQRVPSNNNTDTTVRIIPTLLAHSAQEPKDDSLSTVDLVQTCPTPVVQALRNVAFFGASAASLEHVTVLQQVQSQFLHSLHTVRQAKLERQQEQPKQKEPDRDGNPNSSPYSGPRKLKVYTDHVNDPMGLAHAESGLDTSIYELVQDPLQADIFFVFQSLFRPNCPIYNHTQNLSRPTNLVSKEDEKEQEPNDGERQVLINQFPYEGAWVQKDHLARGILEQHGWPLRDWALPSFDLDVHLAHFVALASSQSLSSSSTSTTNPSLWIVKPAHGTQSRGHVITSSVAQIVQLCQAGARSRVAQRYLDHALTDQAGRKIDCRCLVVVQGGIGGTIPQLYLHKRVYFRIAHLRHSVQEPQDWINPHIVFTASHLVADQAMAQQQQHLEEEKSSSGDNKDTTNDIETLPVDYKTIAHLEAIYPGEFDWQMVQWPKIQQLVRELFEGMWHAHADKLDSSKTSCCRAVYGIDVMFERIPQHDNNDQAGDNASFLIEPKLTEVTFCPSNNGTYTEGEILSSSSLSSSKANLPIPLSFYQLFAMLTSAMMNCTNPTIRSCLIACFEVWYPQTG